MKAWRVILSAVLIWLVQTVIIMLTCGWLFNWVYRIPPMIWLTPEQMSGMNMVWSSLASLITAFIFVFVYLWICNGLPFSGAKRGIVYGVIVWILGALCGMVTMPFYMTISWWVILYWTIQFLVIGVIKGAIVGAICKKV